MSHFDAVSVASASGFGFAICRICGFWRHVVSDGFLGTSRTVPYARSFEPEAHAPALKELARQVRTSAERLYTLNPRNFELFVGTVLRDLMDCDVMHVGGTGDGGVDLLVLDADPPLLVQVKRRARPAAAEGVEVVKSMFASMFAAGRNRGMIVTSANRFTRGATAWARNAALSRGGFELDLVDANRLIDMTRASKVPSQPAWETAMAQLATEEAWDEFSRTLASRDADGARISAEERGDECVVETADGSYVFVRPDRDTCTFRSRVTTSPGQQPPPRPVTAFEFDRLLQSWPTSVADAVVDFWAGPNREDLVEWKG